MWPPTHFTVRELIDRLRSYIISLSIICPVVAGENYYSPAFTDQRTKAQGVWVHLLQSQGHKVSKLGFHTDLYVPTPLSLCYPTFPSFHRSTLVCIYFYPHFGGLWWCFSWSSLALGSNLPLPHPLSLPSPSSRKLWLLAFSQLLEDSANALGLASNNWPYITQQKSLPEHAGVGRAGGTLCGPTSHLSSREGFLQPWASITWLRFSQRLFPGPLSLPICSWEKLLWQHHCLLRGLAPPGLCSFFQHCMGCGLLPPGEEERKPKKERLELMTSTTLFPTMFSTSAVFLCPQWCSESDFLQKEGGGPRQLPSS